MAIFYTDSGSFNSLTVTGSVIMSASNGGALQLIGSGSSILSVSGSGGNIFSISDISASDLNLFSVSTGSINIFSVDSLKNVSVSGSLIVTGSITGSLFGTSSFATSASFSTTASYAMNAGVGSGFPFSGSAVITGSLVVSGSGGLTVLGPSVFKASGSNVNAVTVQSPNYVGGLAGTFLTINAISGSATATIQVRTNGGLNNADLALGSGTNLIGTVSGSLIGTATTASYVLQSVSSSFATTSQTASFINSLNQNVLITGSLTISSSTAQFLAPDGTTTNPSYAFSNATNTGFRSVGSGGTEYVASGVSAYSFYGNSFRLNPSNITIRDTLANHLLGFRSVNAVSNGRNNYIRMANSDTGSVSNPRIEVTTSGTDINISLDIVPSGSGTINLLGGTKISGSLTQPVTTGSQLYAVNLQNIITNTAPNQTQTALRVLVGFTGSFSGSNTQNIIADFGASSVGTQFSVNDTTSGSIYMVNDVSGLPIIEATSNWNVNIYDYPNIVLQKTGSSIIISGSLRMTPSSSFVLPLTASVPPATGSMYWSGSLLFVYNGTRYMSSSFF